MNCFDFRTRIRLGDFPVGLHQRMSSYKPVFADVAEIVLHPKRDIALIKLESPIEFTGKDHLILF